MKRIQSHSFDQMIILSMHAVFLFVCNCLFPLGLFFFDFVLFLTISYTVAIATTAFIIGSFFYDDGRASALHIICFIWYWFIVYNTWIEVFIMLFLWYCMIKLAHRYFYHGHRLFVFLYGLALTMQGIWFWKVKGFFPWSEAYSSATLYINAVGVVFLASFVIYLSYGKQGNRGAKSNLSSRKVRTP